MSATQLLLARSVPSIPKNGPSLPTTSHFLPFSEHGDFDALVVDHVRGRMGGVVTVQGIRRKQMSPTPHQHSLSRKGVVDLTELLRFFTRFVLIFHFEIGTRYLRLPCDKLAISFRGGEEITDTANCAH